MTIIKDFPHVSNSCVAGDNFNSVGSGGWRREKFFTKRKLSCFPRLSLTLVDFPHLISLISSSLDFCLFAIVYVYCLHCFIHLALYLVSIYAEAQSKFSHCLARKFGFFSTKQQQPSHIRRKTSMFSFLLAFLFLLFRTAKIIATTMMMESVCAEIPALFLSLSLTTKDPLKKTMLGPVCSWSLEFQLN